MPNRPRFTTRTRSLTASIAALFAVSLFFYQMYYTPGARAVSTSIVISQIYGGGSNASATYTHDYIELFNTSNVPVSISGWSLQYTSATGAGLFGSNSTLITELPAATIQPGQYFL